MIGPPPRFEPDAYTTTASDEVVFFLDNQSPVEGGPHAIHTFAIGLELGRPLVVSDGIDPRTAAVFTVQGLAAGEYVIWCTRSEHAGLGQTGTITVS